MTPVRSAADAFSVNHYLAFAPEMHFGMSDDEFVRYSSDREPRSVVLAKLRDRLGWSVSIHALTTGRARSEIADPLRIPIVFHRLMGSRILARLARNGALRGKTMRLLGALDLSSACASSPRDLWVFRSNLFSKPSHIFAARLTRLGVPYLIENHGSAFPVNRSCAAFVRGAAQVIVLSADQARQCVDGYGVPASRVTVISNGVDSEQFASPGAALDAEQYPRLLFVGRPSHAKGFDLALAALRIILRTHPKAVLEVAGKSLEGDQAFFDQAVAALDEETRRHLVLHGWIKSAALADLYGRADVMLFPARPASEGDGEGEPRAVLEAMAAGVPVVAVCGSGGHCEIIERAGAGALAESSAAYAEAAALFVRDTGAILAHKRLARAYITLHHSSEIVYEQYLDCCRRAFGLEVDASTPSPVPDQSASGWSHCDRPLIAEGGGVR